LLACQIIELLISIRRLVSPLGTLNFMCLNGVERVRFVCVSIKYASNKTCTFVDGGLAGVSQLLYYSTIAKGNAEPLAEVFLSEEVVVIVSRESYQNNRHAGF
jgi:hypothetical protein